MKKLFAIASFAFVLSVSMLVSAPALADGCYLCGSGSSNGCQQCRYGDKDTGDARKDCEKKGCKISGTGSCSTAANVKVCRAHPDSGNYYASIFTTPFNR